MKLWIDDLRSPPDDSWTWAKTSAEAMLLVRFNHITDVSFDHDLGGDDTAVRVADLIEERAFWDEIRRVRWAIHSSNPAGRVRLESAMRRADKRWELNELKGA